MQGDVIFQIFSPVGVWRSLCSRMGTCAGLRRPVGSRSVAKFLIQNAFLDRFWHYRDVFSCASKLKWSGTYVVVSIPLVAILHRLETSHGPMYDKNVNWNKHLHKTFLHRKMNSSMSYDWVKQLHARRIEAAGFQRLGLVVFEDL